MSTFCDVALPVPLDMAFTYKIAEQQPVVGGRVLVPFRNQRISGVVTALHDRAPSMQAKTVLQVSCGDDLSASIARVTAAGHPPAMR